MGMTCRQNGVVVLGMSGWQGMFCDIEVKVTGQDF